MTVERDESTAEARRFTLSVEQAPDARDIDSLVGGLVSFNNSRAELEDYRPLAVFLRDDKARVVGGALGHTHWGWLFVSHLWVDESLRGSGHGEQILRAAEREAVARGCRHAHLDTFSFQARPFYERLGYELFGQLEDFPAGHTRYFLRKRDLR
jgi:GNAT superfamily N-acetyltransferase